MSRSPPEGSIYPQDPVSNDATTRRVVILALVIAVLLVAFSFNPSALIDDLAAICSEPSRSADSQEASYLSETASTMTKMMVEMSIRASGDVDSDFVETMSPHHLAAIEMAQSELRYGHNERLRRMAQEVIVTQQQEIAAMRLAVGRPLPSSSPAPDQISSAAANTKFRPSDRIGER
jgi:hypothetical protein